MECSVDENQDNESEVLFVTVNKNLTEGSHKYCLDDEELQEETMGNELDDQASEFDFNDIKPDNKFKVRMPGAKFSKMTPGDSVSDKTPGGKFRNSTPGYKVSDKTSDNDIRPDDTKGDGITTDDSINQDDGIDPDGNNLKMVMEFETVNNTIKKEIPTDDVDKDIESEIRNKYMSYINQTNTEIEDLEGMEDNDEGGDVEDVDETTSNNYMLMLNKDNEYVPITNGRKDNLNTIEKRPFKCDLCGKQFTEFCSLKRHNLVHTKEKPHVCSICGRPFSRYESLTRHMMIHSGDKPHKCEVCGKRFTFPHILNRHLLIHTGDKPYECHICGKMFTLSYHVTRHLLTHTGEKPFSCEVCGRQFSQRGDLSRHELLHSESNPNTCYICGRGFTKLKHLERHIEIHESQIASLTCEICGRKFEKTRSKKMHMKAHVRNAPEPGTVSDEVMQLYTHQKLLLEKKGKSGKKNKVLKLPDSEEEAEIEFAESGSQRMGTANNRRSNRAPNTSLLTTKMDTENKQEKAKIICNKNYNGHKSDKVNEESINNGKSDKLLEKQNHEKVCQKITRNAKVNVKRHVKESETTTSNVVGIVKSKNKVGQTGTVNVAGSGKFHGKVCQTAVPNVADKVSCCHICEIYFLNVDQFNEHMATIHEDEIPMEEGEEYEDEEEEEESEKEIQNYVDRSKKGSTVDPDYKYVL